MKTEAPPLDEGVRCACPTRGSGIHCWRIRYGDGAADLAQENSMRGCECPCHDEDEDADDEF